MPRSTFNSFLPRWLLFIAWVIVITWLSLTPSPPVVEDAFFSWDKFQHATAYGAFTLFAGWAFGYFPLPAKRRWRWAFVAAVLFGGLLEVAQGAFTENRTAEWGDLLADAVGAGCIYLLMGRDIVFLERRKND